MLRTLHTLYKIILCVALNTLCGVKLLHRTVLIFCVHSEKIYTGHKKFTRASPVVPMTNIMYARTKQQQEKITRKQKQNNNNKTIRKNNNNNNKTRF